MHNDVGAQCGYEGKTRAVLWKCLWFGVVSGSGLAPDALLRLGIKDMREKKHMKNTNGTCVVFLLERSVFFSSALPPPSNLKLLVSDKSPVLFFVLLRAKSLVFFLDRVVNNDV